MKDNLRKIIQKKEINVQSHYSRIYQEQLEMFHLLNNRGYLFFAA